MFAKLQVAATFAFISKGCVIKLLVDLYQSSPELVKQEGWV